MILSLLTTKLYIPPLRPELVPRPRLVERLDAGLHNKLTLISAPAGFGKTTLANAWLRSTGRPVTWLSLDEGDNDLGRFLHYLVAALQRIDGGLGQAARRLLEAPQPPPAELLLTELINDVAARPAPFVLVLDDYHAITELGVHEALSFLLDRQPPQMHLVILSRQDPPVPLSRLRGRGQVTEIRHGDLCFTVEEATRFLNQAMGLDLEASEVAALEAQTEGWIAGLQMAAVALQPRPAGREAGRVARFLDGFAGQRHFILDYLADEVLERQPEPVHRFLLQTSILKRMCGPLCDAVLGRAADEEGPLLSSREILEHLQRANLFVVPLDDEGQWVRYHRLFAELLRARLQERAPDRVAGLHLRAARWHEQNELLAEAVYHALQMPDSDLAAGIIERAIPRVRQWSGVDVALFQEWLRALPEEVLRARPRLRLFGSRVLYVMGQRERTERILGELEASLAEPSSIPEAKEILGAVLADRASYAAVRGDVRQAIELTDRALAHLPEGAMMHMRLSVALGMAHLRAGHVVEASRALREAIAAAEAADLGFVSAPVFCNLAEVQIVQGQLRQAAETCRQALDLAIVDGTPTAMAGFPGLELGRILYEQNDLPAAERYVSESLELLGRSGTTDSFGIGHALLARIRQARGDGDGAAAAIRRAVQIAQGFDLRRVSTLIEAHQARIWLAQRRLEPAARWAWDYGRLGETEYLREFEELTVVRALLAQDRPAEALAMLDRLLPPAEAAGRMGTAVEILALRALALQGLAQGDQALQMLERALHLAEPEGYVRLFVDEGEPMVQLLRRAAGPGIAPRYAAQLLAVLCPPTAERPGVDMSSLIEPLSGREIEVLHLLAAGLANPEIAQRLFVSLPTVKTHTRNIYGKLGVHTRKEAVARARMLGILPS